MSKRNSKYKKRGMTSKRADGEPSAAVQRMVAYYRKPVPPEDEKKEVRIVYSAFETKRRKHCA